MMLKEKETGVIWECELNEDSPHMAKTGIDGTGQEMLNHGDYVCSRPDAPILGEYNIDPLDMEDTFFMPEDWDYQS